MSYFLSFYMFRDSKVFSKQSITIMSYQYGLLYDILILCTSQTKVPLMNIMEYSIMGMKHSLHSIWFLQIYGKMFKEIGGPSLSNYPFLQNLVGSAISWMDHKPEVLFVLLRIILELPFALCMFSVHIMT